jgi:hypothetical protein
MLKYKTRMKKLITAIRLKRRTKNAQRHRQLCHGRQQH